MAEVCVLLAVEFGVLGMAWREMLRDERRRRTERRAEGSDPPLPEEFPEGPLGPEDRDGSL